MRSTGVQLGPLIAASLIVLVGVAVGLALAARAVNRRVRRAEAAGSPDAPQDPYRAFPSRPPPSAATDLAPLYYVLSVLFWPVGLGLGIHFLRDAKTARMGRVCVFLGMTVIGTVSLFTCVGVVVGGALFSRARSEPSVTATRPYTTPYTTPYTPPAPTGPAFTRAKMGKAASMGGLEVTFIGVDRSFLPPRYAAPTTTQGPVTYVSFDVSIKNVGDRIESVGSHQLQLFDSEGHAFRPHYTGKSPSFTSVSLTPDNLVRGWVTFEIPASSKPQRLQLMAHTRSGQQIAELVLDD